jgi:hypothetical protein
VRLRLTAKTEGHLHDGGDNMKVSVNGHVVCESKAEYAGISGDAKWDTIKQMSQCKEPVPVKKGDRLVIEAAYDLNKHPSYVSNYQILYQKSTHKVAVALILMEMKPRRWV